MSRLRSNPRGHPLAAAERKAHVNFSASVPRLMLPPPSAAQSYTRLLAASAMGQLRAEPKDPTSSAPLSSWMMKKAN